MQGKSGYDFRNFSPHFVANSSLDVCLCIVFFEFFPKQGIDS